MAYTKTNWQDLPSTQTPITANNLNNIENGIEETIQSVEETNNKIGDLSNLKTSDKSSVVNAINTIIDAEVYSTNEVKTNKIWIDGKPIYRKVFNRGNNISSFNHNIANVDLIWIDSAHSIRKHPSGNVFNMVGGTNDSTSKLGIYVNDTEVYIDNIGGLSPSEIYITLEYTKTTD